MNLHLQPIQVDTGSPDRESRLVFSDGFLVAVLVQLSDEHGDDAGMWHLEAGFGLISGPEQPPFLSLDAAQAWINERLRGTGFQGRQ